MTTISVTAEHIARGEPENCERCPVALAIMDALPHVGVPAVDSTRVTFSAPADTWIDVELPLKVSQFIWDFDDSGRGDPFTFELDYPAVTA